MKKLFACAAFCVLIGILTTGCCHYSINGNQSVQPMAKMRPVVYQPVMQVDTRKKVSGTAIRKYILGFISWGDCNVAERSDLAHSAIDCTNSIRSAALYNACKTAGCDTLVAASYDISVCNYIFYSCVTCTVKGFPAKVISVEEVKCLKDCRQVCPMAKNGCPKVMKECPMACPKAGKECPKAGKECPKAGKECPKAGKECPKADKESPKNGK